jgi:hypothetical protein
MTFLSGTDGEHFQFFIAKGRRAGPSRPDSAVTLTLHHRRRHSGAPTNLGFTRDWHSWCPGRQQPTWVRRARNPVTQVGDYWIPGYLATLGPREDGNKR